MNTETFKIVDTAAMQQEIEESIAAGRAPAKYIPVGGESRQARRARERKATKAMKKLQKKGRVTA